MTKIFLSLVLTAIIIGCTQNRRIYEVEDAVTDCLYSDYESHNQNPKLGFDSIESVLIQNGFLHDASGLSYLDALCQIRDSDDLKGDLEGFWKDFRDINFIPQLLCDDLSFLQTVDSIRFANSKFNYILSVFDSIEQIGDVPPLNHIVGKFLTKLDARDFKNEFYRILGITTIYQYLETNRSPHGICVLLPPNPSDEQKIKNQRNILTVFVGDDSLMVEGQLIKIYDLREIVKNFLLGSLTKVEIDLPTFGLGQSLNGIVSLQHSKKAEYKFYCEVYNEITSAYHDVRDKYAKEYFDVGFDDLDQEKQQKIKNLVPQLISESEPVSTRN
ncbi:MAG: hypothetical protein H6607_01705 [Flavobacteriales bacterium]|nr:hypothetical protein [Flavobacteriales bacterium]